MSRHPVGKQVNKWSRKLHRWGSILIALPVAIVIASGIVLQLKKDVAWVQPPTQRSSDPALAMSFEEILEVTRTVPEAEVESWDDVDRLDVRPGRGVAKVRCNNRWEVQIDTNSGEVLSSTYRRSDLIEQIHDGSWFHDAAKLWIFLPSGIVLFALWLTGMWLWLLPFRAKRNAAKRRAEFAANRSGPGV